MFFKDVSALTPRTKQELEVQGRRVMATLLDQDDDINKIRVAVLGSDDIWAQMDERGNVAQFNLIDGLRNYNPVQLADVSSDWITIAWWSDSVSKVAPQLKTTLTAISASSETDPTKDPKIMEAHGKLAGLLGAVTRNSEAPYVHGWSEAVTFGLTGGKAQASMDLAWSGQKPLHYSS